MKARRLKKLFMGAVLAASLTFVAGKTPLLPAVQVQAAGMQDVEWDTSVDFEKAFQKALDTARYSKGGNTIYRIKIPAGTYKAGSSFNVYSNTYIDMEGVTLVRTSSASMFRFGRSADVTGISGYTGFENITFHGGTIDGQGAEHPNYTSTLIRFAHSRMYSVVSVPMPESSDAISMA